MFTALALAAWLAQQASAPVASSVVWGSIAEHEVARGETLTDLAARFGVDPQTIARQNQLQAARPLKAGTSLRIDARHIVPVSDEPLIVNVPQRHAFLFTDEGEVVAFPVAVGRPSWRTPRGLFRIIEKRRSPTWHVPPSIQEEMRRSGKPVLKSVPPSAANPLGDYWLGLSLGGIGLHSTNAPRSVYTATTHGCIRVHPDRVAVLYDAVDVGNTGRVIYEPVLVAVSSGRIYVEAHRDIYGLSPPAHAYLREICSRLQIDDRIDWKTADAVLDERAGVAVDVTKRP